MGDDDFYVRYYVVRVCSARARDPRRRSSSPPPTRPCLPAPEPNRKPNAIVRPTVFVVSFAFSRRSSRVAGLKRAQGHEDRKFGHEFLEFELRPDGKLRYANNSNYKHDTLIKKEVFVSRAVVEEAKRIVRASEIHKESDARWPEGDRAGRQELELVLGEEHISLATAKIGSLLDVQSSKDPEGLRVFYYVVQDLKALVFSLINLHVKLRPIG